MIVLVGCVKVDILVVVFISVMLVVCMGVFSIYDVSSTILSMVSLLVYIWWSLSYSSSSLSFSKSYSVWSLSYSLSYSLPSSSFKSIAGGIV